MPRSPRDFSPGNLLHVVNHGQAHAPVFESAGDVDRLLSLLGWAVVEGWIRVLAYTVLATHFHLILETPDGRLDAAMRRVQAAFAIWRNRTRGRTGHVFKGRYFARLIRGDVDLAGTLDYIDRNPVTAGIVTRPDAYPYGSARAYVDGGGPRWLARDPAEGVVCRLARTERYSGASYPRLWEWAQRSGVRDMMVRGPVPALAEVPVLSRAGPAYVQAWMREHLLREEGRSADCLVLPGEAVLRLREGLPAEDGVAPVAGLLHSVAGWPLGEIARALGISRAAAARRVAEHRTRMSDGSAYATRCARLVAAGLRQVFGPLLASA